MYITLILIIILFFELSKLCDYTEYYVSAVPTPQSVATDAGQSIYVLADKEIAIGSQAQGAVERKWVYNNIQGIPSKYILAKARFIVNGNQVEQTKMVHITKTYAPQELFGTAGILSNTNQYDVNYFITFLSDTGYAAELARITAESQKLTLYNNCIEMGRGTGVSPALVAERCRAAQQ